MKAWSQTVALSLFAATVGACATSHLTTSKSVVDAASARKATDINEVRQAAPDVVASAERELSLAQKAASAGDHDLAERRGAHALALFDQARLVARLARATKRANDSTTELAAATALAERQGSARRAIDRENDDLEKKLRVAREAEVPAPSRAADPERERARLTTARTLLAEAKWMCGAAQLLASETEGLSDATKAVENLEGASKGTASSSAIDTHARARATCLAVLTKARSSLPPTQPSDPSDSLLEELSKSGHPNSSSTNAATDLLPSRDERGVIVTVASAFQGDTLSSHAESLLRDLGRIAAAHPAFALQLVMYTNGDAASPNKPRERALTDALVKGGAPFARIQVQRVAAGLARSDRTDLVFVSPSRT
jgi:hypothetical protein